MYFRLLKEQEVGHFGENSNGVLVSDDPLRVNKSPDGDNYKRNDHRSTGPTGIYQHLFQLFY
jgi:hypothetical protein